MSTTEAKPHPHAANLIEWLKDTSKPLWRWDTAGGMWLELLSPLALASLVGGAAARLSRSSSTR